MKILLLFLDYAIILLLNILQMQIDIIKTVCILRICHKSIFPWVRKEIKQQQQQKIYLFELKTTIVPLLPDYINHNHRWLDMKSQMKGN